MVGGCHHAPHGSMTATRGPGLRRAPLAAAASTASPPTSSTRVRPLRSRRRGRRPSPQGVRPSPRPLRSRRRGLRPRLRPFRPGPRGLRPGLRELRPGPRDLRPGPRELRPRLRELRPGPRDLRPGPRELRPRLRELRPGPRDPCPVPRELCSSADQVPPSPRWLCSSPRRRCSSLRAVCSSLRAVCSTQAGRCVLSGSPASRPPPVPIDQTAGAIDRRRATYPLRLSGKRSQGGSSRSNRARYRYKPGDGRLPALRQAIPRRFLSIKRRPLSIQAARCTPAGSPASDPSSLPLDQTGRLIDRDRALYPFRVPGKRPRDASSRSNRAHYRYKPRALSIKKREVSIKPREVSLPGVRQANRTPGDPSKRPEDAMNRSAGPGQARPLLIIERVHDPSTSVGSGTSCLAFRQ